MKKIYFLLLSILLINCSSESTNPLNNSSNFDTKKIKKITILDQDIENGVIQTHEQYDLDFVYAQNNITNVIGSIGNYNENQTYSNGILSNINISANVYGTNSFYIRNLTVNAAGKLEKTVNIDYDIYGQRHETHFEYPNPNLIIVKEILVLPNGNQVLTDQTKNIHFVNGNVQKIEYYNISPNALFRIDKFEYDNKINPNLGNTPNRILADPYHSYVPYILRNYSQLSKNNVVKYTNVYVYGTQEVVNGIYNINYMYDSQTNLPITQSYTIMDSSMPNNGFKITATYQYQ